VWARPAVCSVGSRRCGRGCRFVRLAQACGRGLRSVPLGRGGVGAACGLFRSAKACGPARGLPPLRAGRCGSGLRSVPARSRRRSLTVGGRRRRPHRPGDTGPAVPARRRLQPSWCLPESPDDADFGLVEESTRSTTPSAAGMAPSPSRPDTSVGLLQRGHRAAPHEALVGSRRPAARCWRHCDDARFQRLVGLDGGRRGLAGPGGRARLGWPAASWWCTKLCHLAPAAPGRSQCRRRFGLLAACRAESARGAGEGSDLRTALF
jgi:hypothetical protein